MVEKDKKKTSYLAMPKEFDARKVLPNELVLKFRIFQETIPISVA